jgi:pyruvate dehydrogenase E2 component (dihydrolipoamide acetyltransferase)
MTEMSKFDFKLPDIGEGVMEGEIVKWLVGPGDNVSEDQPMVEVMTDKATVTITSPKKGRVLELGGGEGSIIPVHSTLVVLELSNGEGEAAPLVEKKKEPAATAVGDIKESLPGTQIAAPVPKKVAAPPSGYFNDKPLATPATRQLARELGVDLRAISPTGKGGRVSKDDVRAFAEGGSAPVAAASSAAPRQQGPAIVIPVGERETRTPLKGVRKRIFEKMARSKHTAAHFTFVEECDVTAIKGLRARLKPRAAEQGVKLTFLPFFVKAVVAALKKHPSLNSAFDESTNEIVERHFYNIGIASATEAGLVVPVVHDADQLSVLDIAREIDRLGEATKTGRITPDDLRGSTFTITSLGRQGGYFATPILNTPEVGILGIHQMKRKPVVREGEIVIGDVMLLSLSFDHRIIDGHIGAAFAYEIIGYIQEPDSLWLELT